MSYVYKVIGVDHRQTGQDWVEQMVLINERASDGWEIFAVTAHGSIDYAWMRHEEDD